MKSKRKLYVLFKKDIYIYKWHILSLLSILIVGSFFFFLIFSALPESENGNFMFNFIFFIFIFSFVLGLAAAVYMPLNSITGEEKQRTFKVLKGLPLNNYYIFFSKLFLGYLLSLIVFCLPASIILAFKHFAFLKITETIPREANHLLSLSGYVQLTFVLLLVSTITTSLYMNFQGKQIFIGFQIIFIIFMLWFLLAINKVGKDDLVLNKIFFIPFSKLVRILFLCCPVLIILCIYVGFKLFDQHRSYLKYQ